MKKQYKDNQRVLAIASANRGFGYAVVEGPKMLVNWGVKELRDKRNRYEEKITELMDLCQPDVVVIEDALSENSRRCNRVKRLTRIIAHLAHEMKIEFCRVSRKEVKKVFNKLGANTKHQIALKIALQFPELAPRLPSKRMPWMSEDSRMSIFDAVSLAITFYGK